MGLDDPARNYRSKAAHAAAMQAYDAMLRHVHVPWGALRVPTRFGTTHVLTAGPEAAPCVVLLHGWNACAAGWWPQIDALASHYRLYAPDTIGQGGRSAPSRPPTRGPSYGLWLADVLDGLGIACAFFVGSSGGAWLALKLAELAPDRMAAAALLGPAGIVPVRPGFAIRALLGGWLSPGEKGARRFAELVSPPPLTIDEAHYREGLPFAIGLRAQLPPPTLSDEALHTLGAPTLILTGEHEAVFDPRAVIARARKIPGLRAAEILPGAGHDLTYDRPDEVSRRVVEFLDWA
jgi:pimeloyl-ACP methyl ester carboxylesterase